VALTSVESSGSASRNASWTIVSTPVLTPLPFGGLMRTSTQMEAVSDALATLSA
jgi:hypothetical protein